VQRCIRCFQHIYRGMKVDDREFQGRCHHFFLLLCFSMEGSLLGGKQGLSYPSMSIPNLSIVGPVWGYMWWSFLSEFPYEEALQLRPSRPLRGGRRGYLHVYPGQVRHSAGGADSESRQICNSSVPVGVNPPAQREGKCLCLLLLQAICLNVPCTT